MCMGASSLSDLTSVDYLCLQDPCHEGSQEVAYGRSKLLDFHIPEQRIWHGLGSMQLRGPHLLLEST